MSRLLFAAARGARIERKHYRFKSFWEEARLVWAREPKDCDYDYRIHPDDMHLQYGPISTALRDRVLLDDPWVEGFVAALAYVDKALGCSPVTADYVDYEMSLLIVAESLADEGL